MLQPQIMSPTYKTKDLVLHTTAQVLNLVQVESVTVSARKANHWINPKHWTNKKTYRIEHITVAIIHFEAPLKASGFDSMGML